MDTREEREIKWFNEIVERQKREIVNWGLRFAQENNPVRVGDFVSNESHTIKVESISLYAGSFVVPGCVYYGEEFCKNMKPLTIKKEVSVDQKDILIHVKIDRRSRAKNVSTIKKRV